LQLLDPVADVVGVQEMVPEVMDHTSTSAY
jgi:hypothetical protein